ncbi:hypothetical protein TNCV_1490771 [Trichonephila clavipes]|nr:hypothetical protein TNCV_1490771 [Trichonephila clavipes]
MHKDKSEVRVRDLEVQALMKTIAFNTRHRQENWRKTEIMRDTPIIADHKGNFNRFENQGFTNNRRFEGRRQGGQSDPTIPRVKAVDKVGREYSSFRGQNEAK